MAQQKPRPKQPPQKRQPLPVRRPQPTTAQDVPDLDESWEDLTAQALAEEMEQSGLRLSQRGASTRRLPMKVSFLTTLRDT